MMSGSEPQVLVVGAGPAGLAAARALIANGVGDVLVIDRDDAPGGLPRFCLHPGFGWEYAGWPYSGPGFAARLLRDIAGSRVRIECQTTLLSLRDGPVAEVVGPRVGLRQLRPRAVILATGIRESNRGNLMVPGGRAETGIMTTGQLQQIAARRTALPERLKSLVVAGTEHVAFSAAWTARRAGLAVSAIVGAEERVLSFPPLARLARLCGIRVMTGAEIREIATERGMTRAVLVETRTGSLRLPCDGVVFTGQWIPESAILAGGPVALDRRTGGPEIDQAMRTSSPGIFAAGNVLHGVESSGWCAKEGRHAGEMAARYLRGALSATQGRSRFELSDEVAFTVPQLWDDGDAAFGISSGLTPTLRMQRDLSSARLALAVAGKTVWSGSQQRLLRKRRIRLDLNGIPPHNAAPKRIQVIA